jgi:hypothetical protein
MLPPAIGPSASETVRADEQSIHRHCVQAYSMPTGPLNFRRSARRALRRRVVTSGASRICNPRVISGSPSWERG